MTPLEAASDLPYDPLGSEEEKQAREGMHKEVEEAFDPRLSSGGFVTSLAAREAG